jgi:hypothetical protein
MKSFAVIFLGILKLIIMYFSTRMVTWRLRLRRRKRKKPKERAKERGRGAKVGMVKFFMPRPVLTLPVGYSV